MTRNIRLFRFSDNSSYTRGFTWAASIRPRSEIFRRVCPEFGVVAQYPSGEFDVVVEGGSRYPDILGCGAYPFLIVAESVVNAWREAGITSFHSYLVHVGEVRSKSKRLHETEPPRYHRIEIAGRCKIDLAASGLEVVRFAPECQYLVTKPSMPSRFRMVSGSWDDSSLFRDHLHYPRVSFCTELVLDLARTHRFTNFRFESMEGPYDPGSKGIDYLGRS